MSDAETTHRRRKAIRLFGRRSPRSSSFGALLVLVGGALLTAGCASVANPQGWAPPQLAEGTLYASVDKGKMAALDPGDLSVKWVFPTEADEDEYDLEAIYGAPIVDQGFVYIGAYDGNVYALDATDGALLWAFDTGDAIVNSLELSAGTLFAGSTDGILYAIDARGGDETSRFDTGSSIWASPLVAQFPPFGYGARTTSVIYVPAMDGQLHALDPGTFQPIEGFSFKTDAGLVMDPFVVDDDTLLVGGIDSKLYALDPKTGEERFEPFEGGNWFWGKPAVRGETAYVADLDGNVYALSLVDGEPLWTRPFKTEGAVRSAPLLAGATLIVVDRDGNVYGLNPNDGTPVSEWPTNPNTDERSVALDKTVLSDPFLLERAGSADGGEASPSATPGEETSAPTAETPAPTDEPPAPTDESPAPTDESPAATVEPSPTVATGDDESEAVVLIVAQGGDLCTIDPTDGSPVGSLLCAEVPL